MSFLLGNQKKQVLGNNQKVINNFKNKNFYLNIISGKKYSEKDLSKKFSNLKENKIYSSKFKTQKNSRNYIIFILIFFYFIATQSSKFQMNKKINKNLFPFQIENNDKKDISFTNENILEKGKINPYKSSNKKIGKELKKISEGFFLGKYEKLMNKKGKMGNKNISINTLGNNITNKSLINLHQKLENKFYNKLNITDGTLFKKLKTGINLKKRIRENNNNTKNLKLKSNNKKLMIDCGYFSNNEKYNISGDIYNKKYRAYISSLPNSTRKIINTNSFTKNHKKIMIKPLKNLHAKMNIELSSKNQNQVNIKLNKKINSKKLLENLYENLDYPRISQTSQNDYLLGSITSNQRFSSDFNSIDYRTNPENNSYFTKINILKKDRTKPNEKLLFRKDNLFKSIKVNTNNFREKGNIILSSNNKINTKLNSYINTNINISSFNKKKHLKKIGKNKERLQSCKPSNDKRKKFVKELINDGFLKNKKLAEKSYKKNLNLKINQPDGTEEGKNITFFANYITNNKMFINGYTNPNKYNTNNNNWSSLINNNSEIIRNITNTNFNTNYKNLNTTNEKKKKKFIKKTIFSEEEILKKINKKIKTKALTTLNSKENSKSNINCENIMNSNNKNNYTSSNLINNKCFQSNKKIYINNIINVNNSCENNNNIKNNNIMANNNCYSYRFLGIDKIKSFKNKIIGINPPSSGLDYSFNNQSQRILYQNKFSKNRLQLRDIKLNNNKNENYHKLKNIKKNLIKKNKLIKYQRINAKKLNLNKELLINDDKKVVNPIHKKYESSEIYVHIPQSKNFPNLSNIQPENYQDSFSEKFFTEQDNNNNDNSTNNNNFSVKSTLKECEYYKQECRKLSTYLKDYYSKYRYYPKTDLNFYKYGRLLGKGAFGKVNIALHLASGRLVAIKSFNKKKLANRRAKRKIKTEIEVLSKLRNPFCTQIYDYFETETHILIIMEYICGDLLTFMRKRGKISEPTAKIIFKQIIKGLQYLHKKNIVHRDIKLDNILMDLTNTVKICDFGVSRILSPGDTMYEHCGTPAYIAPEIFRNEGYEGFSCDVWSSGVTLYYMLAGKQPFKGGKLEELKEIILKGQYEEIKDISYEANDLINKMLRLNPKERITIEEILRHPWLKNVDIKNRQKLNLFTNAEKALLAKYDVNYLSSPKEELIEVFTVSNLETKDEKEQKDVTKSDILSPYNSYSKRPDQDIYEDLKIENDICRFNFKAQLSNIKYELSNNQEFDNGIIKTIYNSVENNKNNNKNSSNEITQSLNLSLDSVETFTCGLCDDVIKDIEELIGYNKNYLVQCLRKNEINYATATYYLMLKEELDSNY